jgi:hypothetical protein
MISNGTMTILPDPSGEAPTSETVARRASPVDARATVLLYQSPIRGRKRPEHVFYLYIITLIIKNNINLFIYKFLKIEYIMNYYCKNVFLAPTNL